MGTTTTLALRYPAGSDAPAGHTQIQNLADDVDTALTPTAVTNTTIGFSVASGWSLDQCEGVKWGPVRHLLLRLTRTGSNITSSANGNITDEIVGTVASNDWCAPSTLAYVTAQSRNAVSSGSCLLYANGTINIGSLNGDGAEIRTDDFVRVTFTWMHTGWTQT